MDRVATMVVLRRTQKLRRRMGEAGTEPPSPKSSTRLGHWYANEISVHRQHLVLAVSGVTLLHVLVSSPVGEIRVTSTSFGWAGAAPIRRTGS